MCVNHIVNILFILCVMSFYYELISTKKEEYNGDGYGIAECNDRITLRINSLGDRIESLEDRIESLEDRINSLEDSTTLVINGLEASITLLTDILEDDIGEGEVGEGKK